ncbi:ATP-binding protein [Geopsychrobacter electrodiphilus]|uniref:ATP-binding protein n=1 Tax=Geopsychrobacter electrodiphilus TaxID=225196 RepID=UPI00036D9FC0|nr:HAMP domain-containing sensor histidine kinase [Geopsychrobacter electrodiphilus]
MTLINLDKKFYAGGERVHQDAELPSSEVMSQTGEMHPSDWDWKYGQILENIDVGVLVLDLEERRVDFHNSGFSAVFQDPRICDDFERLKGLLLVDLKMPASGPASILLPYRDRTLGCSVYELGPRYRCIFVRDISEKMRLESIAQAVNTMDNIGFIFSGIRHEIGNPLNSLKMALSVLRNNLDTFDRQMVVEYIDRGLADIGRVEFLLKSMKSFAMFERVELKDVDLGDFLKRFVALIGREFNERGISLVFDNPEGLVKVRIDSRALHQALLNLLANAADALDGVTEPEIHVFAEERDQLVRLVVADNGRGISEAQRRHLFKPFNTSKPHGNGLGLVITRKLLAQMNADITVESSPGNGTLAIVSLPISHSQA